MFRLLRIVLGLAAAGIVGRLAYIRMNKLTYPDPGSYVIHPEAEVTIEQQPDGHYRIQTAGDAQVSRVYTGISPDAIDRTTPLNITETGEFSPVDTLKRQFYEVELTDGRRIHVAERELKLEGGFNFRDIGGYPAKDGRSIKWGQIYRSGSLYELSGQDWQQVEGLGIQLICDLRGHEEVQAEPDKVLDGTEYVHTPIETETTGMDRLRSLFVDRRKLKQFMPRVYTRLIIDQHAQVMGDNIRRLANPDNLPAIIHCSAGKDRTGVLVALILLALGVPDDYVVADYTLSNTYYDAFYRIAEKALKPLAVAGFNADDVQPMLTADAENIRQTINYIREHYGSARHYLTTMAGLDDETLAQLETTLLD